MSESPNLLKEDATQSPVPPQLFVGIDRTYTARGLLLSEIRLMLAAILIFHFVVVILSNTDLLGVRWLDSLMSWMIMSSRNPYVYWVFNSLCNYVVALVNLAAYSILIALLWRRKLISFTRSNEIKMTLQVLCMVTCEVLFFIFWEFGLPEKFGAWNLVIEETTNLLFFDVLVLPYLIFNKRIHQEIRAIGKYSLRSLLSPQSSKIRGKHNPKGCWRWKKSVSII
ncbi:hypothetical protein Y032_0020g85 [Ancylostoma ceylanicum]|uniref:Serpentine receptor class gamma n=1 Tax=Ancylostoma ceylanicum TaxID=53326 RepID=A0A016V1C4_9BILA|nr:hypothetical protein Y032_0020g85 [Ancylostoma ceylanicum]